MHQKQIISSDHSKKRLPTYAQVRFETATGQASPLLRHKTKALRSADVVAWAQGPLATQKHCFASRAGGPRRYLIPNSSGT